MVAIFVISSMFLGVYFAAGSSAQFANVGNLKLSIYHRTANQEREESPLPVFSSGETIWLKVPRGGISYWFSVYHGGQLIENRKGTLPESFLPVSLNPSTFPVSNSYFLNLQVVREPAFGLMVLNSYQAAFSVVPSSGKLALDTFEIIAGQIRLDARLSDLNLNPLTGVRLGLFLKEHQSEFQITSDLSNSTGFVRFWVGQSLAAGNYSLEVRVLDSNAIFTEPLLVTEFTVAQKPTILAATETRSGTIQATILETGSLKPLRGRLLSLERQLADGNWAIVTSSYTSDKGVASFARPSSSWRVSFNGDNFYAASRSNVASVQSSVQTGTQQNTQTSNQSHPSKLSTSKESSPDTPMPCKPSPIESIQPDCGGGGDTLSTTTTLYVPTTVYATIPITLKAYVKDQWGSPVRYVFVKFYNDGSLLGTSLTNTTGYAALAWTPGVTSLHTVKAEFTPVSASYLGSSDQKSLNVNPTPTTVMLLKPLPIAYSWHVDRPITVAVVTLELALSGDGSPPKTYTVPYNGTSTSPPSMPGYGWRGLNQTVVRVTSNDTYTQYQTVNWAQDLYVPACVNSVCSPAGLPPRTGHLNVGTMLMAANTLYSISFTALNIPYQNVDGTTLNSNTLTLDATPPSHLYVNLTATYPFLTVKIQDLPVALANYGFKLSNSLGPSPSSYSSGGYTYYTVPSSANFLYACSDPACATPGGQVSVDFLNGSGAVCQTSTTDAKGIASTPQGALGPAPRPIQLLEYTPRQTRAQFLNFSI